MLGHINQSADGQNIRHVLTSQNFNLFLTNDGEARVPGRVCPFDSRRNNGRTRHGHGVQPRKEGKKNVEVFRTYGYCTYIHE
jgi:hypothetical protein